MPVLICYDGSTSAHRALSVAASALDGAPMVLLDILEPTSAGVGRQLRRARERVRPRPCAARGRRQSNCAAEILAEGEAEAQVRGFAVTTRQEANRSSVWKTILDVADEVDASLIVAGTRGATAVESGLLGSVSNALVHHAHRPCCWCPPPSRRRFRRLSTGSVGDSEVDAAPRF